MNRILVLVIAAVAAGQTHAQDKKLTAQDYYERGRAYRRDPDKAIPAFTEAIKLDSNMTDAYVGRANAWNKKREFDKAIADFNIAIKLNSKHRLAYIGRAEAWMRLEINDNAIRDLTEAIKLITRDDSFMDVIDLYWMRGSAYLEKKDYDKAIVDFNHMIWRDARHPRGYALRGQAHLGKKEYAKAVNDFNGAVRNWENNPIYLSDRGLAHFYNKEYEKALADFDAADKIDKEAAWTCLHRALMLASCADPKYRDGNKAIQVAMSGIERLFKESDPSYHIVLAAAHAEAGDFAAAVRYQEKVLAITAYREDQEMQARLELYKKRQPFRQP